MTLRRAIAVPPRRSLHHAFRITTPQNFPPSALRSAVPVVNDTETTAASGSCSSFHGALHHLPSHTTTLHLARPTTGWNARSRHRYGA